MPKRSAPVRSSSESISRASFLRLMFGAAGALGGMSLLGTSCGEAEDDRSDASTASPDAGDELPDAGVDHADAGDDRADAGDERADAGDDAADAGEDPECVTPTASIGSNHGHLLVVPIADVEAGVEQTYDIEGSSGHAHFVTLTAAHMAQLAEGDSVTVTSTSGGGHTHSVTVRCDS